MTTLAATPRLCSGCGYDLRAHSIESPCPECATPYLSGEITVTGLQETSNTWNLRTLLFCWLVLAIFSFAMMGSTKSSPKFGPEILPGLAILAILLVWALFFSKRSRQDSLRLSSTGVALARGDTGRTLHEPWTRHTQVDVVMSKLSKLSSEPVAQIQITCGDPFFSFITPADPGTSKAIERQAKRWIAEANISESPLACFSRCPDCLKSKCNCPAKSSLELYCVPAYSFFDSRTSFLPALMGGTMPMMGQSIARGQFKPFLVAVAILSCLNLLLQRRYSKERPSREIRFSPNGYQFCRPNTPLRLKPWGQSELRFRRQSFGKVDVGFVTPKQFQLTENYRTIALPAVAQQALDAKQRIWRISPRVTRGFPMA